MTQARAEIKYAVAVDQAESGLPRGCERNQFHGGVRASMRERSRGQAVCNKG
jgi:hypothetical protein